MSQVRLVGVRRPYGFTVYCGIVRSVDDCFSVVVMLPYMTAAVWGKERCCVGSWMLIHVLRNYVSFLHNILFGKASKLEFDPAGRLKDVFDSIVRHLD